MQDIEARVSEAFKAMQAEANMHNLQGVCVVAIAKFKENGQLHVVSESIVVGRLVRQPDTHTRGKGDLGSNYYSIAQMKVGEMIDTLCNSGESNNALKFGEPGFRGGVIEEIDGVYYMTAFSGASEAEDVQVAKRGMFFLTKPA